MEDFKGIKRKIPATLAELRHETIHDQTNLKYELNVKIEKVDEKLDMLLNYLKVEIKFRDKHIGKKL